MKRLIFSGLIFLMLFLMVFPIPIYAEDTSPPSTRTPYDWLNEDEQAYVTALRADILIVQVRVKTARDGMGSIIFGDRKAWYSAMEGAFTSINNGLDDMAALTPPAEFTAIGKQAYDLPGVSLNELDILDEMLVSAALVEAVQMIGHIDGDLNAVGAGLSSLFGGINSRIADIARRREKAVEVVSSLFDSCMERPARPY